MNRGSVSANILLSTCCGIWMYFKLQTVGNLTELMVIHSVFWGGGAMVGMKAINIIAT